MADGLVNTDISRTPWAVKPPQATATEQFDVTELVPVDNEIVDEVEVSSLKDEISTPAIVARRVADLMVDGKTLAEAQEDVPDMLRLSKDLSAQVKRVIAMGHVPADILRASVRAVRNKVMFDSFQDSLVETNADLKNAQRKLALEASKVIGADPEIGLNQPPQVAVQINIEDISDLIRQVDDEER